MAEFYTKLKSTAQQFAREKRRQGFNTRVTKCKTADYNWKVTYTKRKRKRSRK